MLLERPIIDKRMFIISKKISKKRRNLRGRFIFSFLIFFLSDILNMRFTLRKKEKIKNVKWK